MLPLDHCPKCQSNHIVKAGFAYGKQRYRCKGCTHHFTVLHKSTKKDESIRKLAIDMYLEGLGFRAIGRVLGIGVQLFELLKLDQQNVVYQIGENYHGNNNYYNNNEKLQSEIDKLKAETEKLQLIIKHQQERIDDLKTLLTQKDELIQVLRKLNRSTEELIAL